MDELLLQLAESLRKTMSLTSAEVYTGTGEVLERTASVPDLGPASLVVSPRERPVVTRAGVSGTAWASVWLPALLKDRRERADPRRAREPRRRAAGAHRRRADGRWPTRSLRTTTGCSTDLARQVGLALHNSQLDTALQTTLDEVRKQADALRGSRARIVASGDAERRRVERNLHDGAQQHLVALAVNLRLARDIIVDDQEAGLEMLEQLAGEVQETIQELRELAHGDLSTAVGRQRTRRGAPAPRPIATRCRSTSWPKGSAATLPSRGGGLLLLSRGAAERRQARARIARSRSGSGRSPVACSSPCPTTDRGSIPEKAQRGHGYVNMADRFGAIGGTVRWDSEVGKGSQVRGSVPLV